MTKIHWSLFKNSTAQSFFVWLVLLGLLLAYQIVTRTVSFMAGMDNFLLALLSMLGFLSAHVVFISNSQRLGEEELLMQASGSINNYVAGYLKLTFVRSLVALIAVYIYAIFAFMDAPEISKKIFSVDGFFIGCWFFLFIFLTSLVNRTAIRSRVEFDLAKGLVTLPMIVLPAAIIIVALLWMPLAGFMLFTLLLLAQLFRSRSILFRVFADRIQYNILTSMAGFLIVAGIGSLFLVHEYEPRSFLVWGTRNLNSSMVNDEEISKDLDAVQSANQLINWMVSAPQPVPIEFLMTALNKLDQFCPRTELQKYFGVICFEKGLTTVKTGLRVVPEYQGDKYLKLLKSASKSAQMVALMGHYAQNPEVRSKEFEALTAEMSQSSEEFLRLKNSIERLKPEVLERGFQVWVFPEME